MTIPLLTELPYRADSATLFEAVADRPWAVFLDSGLHYPGQARYDIIAVEPHVRLITRGGLTEVHGETSELSRADPFELLRTQLAIDASCRSERPEFKLPFVGGAIGYFGYDLARRLERLPARARDAERIPDMAVGIYDWAVVVDHSEQRTWLVGQGRDPDTDRKWDGLVRLFTSESPERQRVPFRVTSAVTSKRFTAHATGDPWLAYQRLRLINPAPYSAYMNTPYAQILSASPERFLRVANGQVETKPIKGTRPRAGHAKLDAERIAELVASEKDRAENLMIVDLLRNDLSKNCAIGSVKVPRLFEVESFATVHHLVSTVTGRLAEGRDAIDLLRGAFPGGSITGAPKTRAMQIIEELEPHRRGVYCGAIGYIGYDGDMDSNIAIRTLVHSRGIVRFWAGGGIVADSQRDAEYQETFDKAAALLSLLQQSAESASGGT
jgi:para-aminobenzoate synthetase component 1